MTDALARFSPGFRQDVEKFRERFEQHEVDLRGSAFWRAVAHEALDSEPEGLPPIDRKGSAELLATRDDFGLSPFVLCTSDFTPPEGLTSVQINPLHDDLDHVLQGVEDGNGPAAGVREVVEGRLSVPRATLHARNGCIIFGKIGFDTYEVVSGSDAEGARHALVRNDLLGAFVRIFGGEDRPAMIREWSWVDRCRVTVSREAPDGLGSLTQLLRTMPKPVPRLVEGIRTERHYFALKGHLPKVRFRDACSITVVREGEDRSIPAERDADDPTLWHLPSQLLQGRGPRSWVIHAEYPGPEGQTLTESVNVSLDDVVEGHRYKLLPSGDFLIEADRSPEEEIGGHLAIPMAWSVEDSADSADLLEIDPTLRGLGHSVGEVMVADLSTCDWLATGPLNRPSQLLFVGDPEAPRPSTGIFVADGRARRLWKKGMNCPRARCRDAAGSWQALKLQPALLSAKSALLRQQRQSEAQAGDLGASADQAGQPQPEESHAWMVADCLSALAQQRAGLPFGTVEALIGSTRTDEERMSKRVTREVLRSWIEAGAMDIAVNARWRSSIVLCRRPCLVSYRSGSLHMASLIGLVPRSLRDRVTQHARRMGIKLTFHIPTSWMTPTIMRFVADDASAFSELSRELDLSPPRALVFGNQGIDRALDCIPDHASRLHRRELPSGFEPTLKWDWEEGRFRGLRGELAGEGIAVVRHEHTQQWSCTALHVDGSVVGWSRFTAPVLLAAYARRSGFAPFALDLEAGRLVRVVRGDVHLPILVGRLCAIVGARPAGLAPVPNDVTIQTYTYPLGRPAVTRIASHLDLASRPPLTTED